MDQTEKIVSGIIKFLRATNQLEALPKVVEKLKEESLRFSGKNTAIITSAYHLSGEELKQVEKHLFIVFKKKLEIVNKVDPKVIGGFIIQVSDEIIDFSLNGYVNGAESIIKNEKK